MPDAKQGGGVTTAMAANAGAQEADRRAARLRRFLESAGWGDAERQPLARDASFRSYDRLIRSSERAVLMDAPPDKGEDVRPFLAVAAQLHRYGYSAPRIVAEDRTDGFLLLEDLGDITYTRALGAGAEEVMLYARATDLLIDLHRRTGALGYDVPPYSDDKLVAEAALPLDWYFPLVLGRELDQAERASYEAAWRDALAVLRGAPDTLVLRDFHVDNLMVLPGRPGIAACGLLDFQDAVEGPVTYDLASLLQDSRRDLAPGLEDTLLDRYRAATPIADPVAFDRIYYGFGAQRGLKVFGIFGRQSALYDNPRYLHHIPRIWRHVERDLILAGLDDVRAWLDTHIPTDSRVQPAPEVRRPT
jgi:N-acetylmuramate 1-kinase